MVNVFFSLRGRFIEINKTPYRIVEKKTKESTRRQIIEKKTKIHGSCNIVLCVIELIKRSAYLQLIHKL